MYRHQVGQVLTTNLLSSFGILILLTPLRLVLVLQYLTNICNPSFMVLSSLVLSNLGAHALKTFSISKTFIFHIRNTLYLIPGPYDL